MPDTFGKRQREADKAKRREAKDARRVARKAGELAEATPSPFDDPRADDVKADDPEDQGPERGESADDPS